VDSAFAAEYGLETRRDGTLTIDRFTSRTNRARFFAGGDMVTGASNVSNAMALGKQAAERIDADLMGESRFASLFPGYEIDHTVPVEPEGGPRNRLRLMDPAERATCFQEVCLGLEQSGVLLEAVRCLRCDVKETARTNGAAAGAAQLN
jgi:NADH-quinone oxidoreductase subunit F